VYSQVELDRVISGLMEQHQGNAPPPARREVIESLPKIKVDRAMVVDEEVANLPCKHKYHFECVKKWLEAHDVSYL
jgi:E3 ubiquitin-protein ligase RNF115/126